jgi:hypothetical protein
VHSPRACEDPYDAAPKILINYFNEFNYAAVSSLSYANENFRPTAAAAAKSEVKATGREVKQL